MTTAMENSMVGLKKLKMGLPCEPSILPLGIYPKELKAASKLYLHTHVHSSIHNIEEVNAPSAHGQMMDKQNRADPYGGILLSQKKEF